MVCHRRNSFYTLTGVFHKKRGFKFGINVHKVITLHHQTKQILTSTYSIMKRITCFFFALALMIGGGAVAQIYIPGGRIKPPEPTRQPLPPKPPVSTKAKYYYVTFTCNAPYADMFIDDENMGGIHGTRELKLKAGSHVVELYESCYNNYSTTINVSGDNKSFHFNLIEKTDPSSQCYLGIYYHGGSDGYPQDYAKAVEHFRNAAEQGDICAQANLGLCYEMGHGVAQDYSEAAKWYQMAAEEFDNIPKKLGEFYEKGLGVTQSYTEAAKWYKKAADHGDVTAQSNLGRCYLKQKDYSEAIKWYKKAAEKGNAEAQADLGYCLYKDYKAGIKWYQKAAEQGHAGAQYNLGYCYEHGDGVKTDYSEALNWYRKAAEQGLALANFKLGYFYTYGMGVEKNYTEAANLFRKATEQELVDTIYNLNNGEEISDYIDASGWYLKALEQGDADAQCKLGDFYTVDFRSTHYDRTKGKEWYRKAAEQGHARALCNLSLCYEWGSGVEKDKQEAARLLKQSAELGYARAQYYLGCDYEYGWLDLKKDNAEAAKWFRKAAEQGNSDAQYHLAQCYKEGKGVKKNKQEAIYWYRKAAEQGNSDAQYELGYIYEKGWGVEKDLTEAVKWYRKAAEHYNSHAEDALKRLGY